MSGAPAAFLDRDGVLIEDAGLLVSADAISIFDGVADALSRLAQAGYALVVVTNQAVVARGLVTEAELDAIHQALASELERRGAPPLSAIMACPHHPEATLPAYRRACQCRKPRPGMLLEAAARLDLDLSRSVMIGDRPTDVIAGQRAGCCATALIASGRHLDAPIVTVDPLPDDLRPTFRARTLSHATDLLLREAP